MPADLEFLDSFQHYSTATLYQKYNNPLGGTIVDGVGRFGVKGLQTSVFGDGPQITFKRNLIEVYCGAAIKVTGVNLRILSLLNNGSPYLEAYVQADGRVAIASNNVIKAVSTYAIETNTFYYFELSGIIDPGPGGSISAEVRVNEETIVTWSHSPGQDQTSNGEFSEYFTQAQIYRLSPGTNYASDFYVHADHFLGDIKVRAIKPNAAGSNSDWSSTGADQWSVTDDIPPNGDSDYVYSHDYGDLEDPGDGAKTSVNMEDVDLDGECVGIQFLANCRKDEANVRKIEPFVLEGGTETHGDSFSLPTNYVYTHDCLDVNPRTGIAWTVAQLNAIEAGAELTE